MRTACASCQQMVRAKHRYCPACGAVHPTPAPLWSGELSVRVTVWLAVLVLAVGTGITLAFVWPFPASPDFGGAKASVVSQDSGSAETVVHVHGTYWAGCDIVAGLGGQVNILDGSGTIIGTGPWTKFLPTQDGCSATADIDVPRTPVIQVTEPGGTGTVGTMSWSQLEAHGFNFGRS